MDYSSYDISQYATGIDYYSQYSDAAMANAAMSTVGAALGAMMGVYMIIAIAVAVLQIVSMWRIFSKAGKDGWKSLIPIYNSVILFKISGLSPWLLLAYLTAFIPVVGWIVILVISILQANGLSKSFGKSTGFTVGLVLLPFIFNLILGFGKSEYVGTSKKEETVVETTTEE